MPLCHMSKDLGGSKVKDLVKEIGMDGSKEIIFSEEIKHICILDSRQSIYKSYGGLF